MFYSSLCKRSFFPFTSYSTTVLKKKTAHNVNVPKSQKKFADQQSGRLPVFYHLQKPGSCHATEFMSDQWEGSVRGECLRGVDGGEMRTHVWWTGGDCMRVWLPDVLTLYEEREWRKDDCVSEKEKACVKDVCPNLFICCTGGYSHCPEVLSCVPLGPTRRLVTHLQVSFL